MVNYYYDRLYLFVSKHEGQSSIITTGRQDTPGTNFTGIIPTRFTYGMIVSVSEQFVGAFGQIDFPRRTVGKFGLDESKKC